MPVERITYATRPSANSNGGYITVYAPDGSYVSRHTNMEECTESALRHAEASNLDGTYVYRFVPPEKHMTVSVIRRIPGVNARGFRADGLLGSVNVLGYAPSVIRGSTQGRPWNPGHWVDPQQSGNDPLEVVTSYYVGLLDEIANTNFRGMMIRDAWTRFESKDATAPGTYDWSLIDAVLAKATAVNKKIIIIVKAGNASLPALPAPQYVRELNGTIVVNGVTVGSEIYWDGEKWGLRRWRPATLTYFIAFFAALADRYKNHPMLEMVGTDESALGSVVNTFSDYSPEGWAAQMTRFNNEVLALFPNKQVRFMDNFLTGGSGSLAMSYLADNTGTGHGGPDIYPQVAGLNTTTGAYTFVRERTLIQKGLMGLLSPFIDYRGKVAGVHNVQYGSLNAWTPAQIFEEFNTYLKGNYLIWQHQPGASQSPWSAVKAFVANPANAVTNTAPPTIGNWVV